MKSFILTVLFLLLSISPIHAKTLLIVGDSLSAGYGISLQSSWVHLLEKRINPLGYQLINISTSGDTTRNGKAKLNKALKKFKPQVVILELGSNDGLRGLTLKQIKSNLSSMISQIKAHKARVLLLATRLPPNYGKTYIRKFRQIYVQLASTEEVPLVPMLLDGIAGNEKLMQSDGLHPNEAAQPLILNTVWPKLKPLL